MNHAWKGPRDQSWPKAWLEDWRTENSIGRKQLPVVGKNEDGEALSSSKAPLESAGCYSRFGGSWCVFTHILRIRYMDFY